MIEGQVRAEAKARQVDALARGNKTMHGGNDGGQLATIQKQPSISHKARDEIAEAVGMVAMLGQARSNSWWPNGHNLSTTITR